MIEKIRYKLLPHNFSLNKDLSNNLNKKRLPIVVWARYSQSEASAILILLSRKSHLIRPLIIIRKIRIDFL